MENNNNALAEFTPCSKGNTIINSQPNYKAFYNEKRFNMS